MQPKNNNILIYRLGSLGDTVIALPCFNKIRNLYPGASITLLTNKPVASKAAPLEAVLGKGLFFDEVIDYPVGTRNPFLLLKILFRIRSLKVNLLINLSAARSSKSVKRDRFFFRACGIKNAVGFPTIPSDFAPSVDPLTGEIEWEAKRLARRITELGTIELDNSESWDLRLTDEEKENASSFLRFNSDKIIAVSAGTKMQAKDWEESNWLALMAELKIHLPGWTMVMVGAPEEAGISAKCLEAWGQDGINLCGKTSPRVSAVILQRAKLFIGHDSGPMHLAAAVGTPCVAIFAARNIPRQWFPRGLNNTIIYHKTDCAGCGLEICIEQKKTCILSISVAEVRDAVLNRIASLPVIAVPSQVTV
jgi:ADP-heptose:LPS heptosyltransferase